jgi:hypothetical protein
MKPICRQNGPADAHYQYVIASLSPQFRIDFVEAWRECRHGETIFGGRFLDRATHVTFVVILTHFNLGVIAFGISASILYMSQVPSFLTALENTPYSLQ